MFRFKQFNVDQSGCAMKINTDGVLLGALADGNSPSTILDVGTGTGVIALMLAQRFIDAKIDAVEIDSDASQTAERNFKASPFADRLKIYPSGFERYFGQYPERKYDLIVSNPPFYIDSLKSPAARTTLAKHTDIDFFERLIIGISKQLTAGGLLWLILPTNIAETVSSFAAIHGIYPIKFIQVRSYTDSSPHRSILCLGFGKKSEEINSLIIYQAEKIYSGEYKKLLQPYFINF